MNYKATKGAAIALTAATLLFAACKKDDDNNGGTSIVGTWSVTNYADDDNNNGTLDASEKTAIAAGDYDYLTFYNNGTLKDSLMEGGISLNVPGTYTLSADRRYINVTIFGSSASGEITQLDGSNLIVRDTSEHPTSWTIYVRK